jgi:hypothetical protein
MGEAALCQSGEGQSGNEQNRHYRAPLHPSARYRRILRGLGGGAQSLGPRDGRWDMNPADHVMRLVGTV